MWLAVSRPLKRAFKILNVSVRVLIFLAVNVVSLIFLYSSSPSMRLRHIEVFNAVMLTGTVSEAARLISVSQPAVSRILQHAELQVYWPWAPLLRPAPSHIGRLRSSLSKC